MEGLAEAIGRIVAKRRVGCVLTQEQVAEHLGIGVEAVSRIERGVVMPTVARLAELADIFQCSLGDLLMETSVRANDQAERLQQLMAKLSAPDRALIVELVERLAGRLSRK
ncbi:transcriptional regulator [Pigmentiphaga litoralis]|uniref:helix-turn-helix domain-containing protein n=1 Tax=Pigmentiphaga litoralis TaxID=516702 RepID=UPI0016777D8D|nr:helix-turn-helix transcriptional regulator [Pigmentiphaga litoralis]GGX19398.1 transcriptional regulator [Pigmentiphaga litoralis]